MSLNGRRLAAGLGLLAVAGAARAAERPPPAPPTASIVVSGRRATPDADLQRVRQITSSTDGLVVRFETPVCPAVYGLPRGFSESMEARIRADIDALGLSSLSPRCRPNLSVFVVSGGARFLTGLFNRNPRLFDDVELHARERLLGSRGPVWSWRLTSARRRDGGPVQLLSSIQFSASEPPRPLARGAYLATDVEHGRLISPVRRDVDAAFVVIDASDIDGMTLQQLADLALVLGLSPVDPARAGPGVGLPTILTLFADRAGGRPAQAGLTAFDRAYLAGLYSGATGYSYAHKTLRMAIRLKTALAGGSSPPVTAAAK